MRPEFTEPATRLQYLFIYLFIKRRDARKFRLTHHFETLLSSLALNLFEVTVSLDVSTDELLSRVWPLSSCWTAKETASPEQSC